MDPRAAGASCWYDASNTRGVTFGSGRAVATLVDLSGNGRDISQATTGVRPTWMPHLFGRDLHGVRFDGSSQWMGDGPRMNLLCSASAYTIVGTVRIRSSSTNAASADSNEALISNLGGYMGLFAKSAAATLGWYHYDGAIKANGAAWEQGTSSIAIIQQVVTGGTSTLRVRGHAGATDSNVSVGANAFDNSVTLRLGRASSTAIYAHADLGEIAFFTTALASSQLASLQAYLMQKWRLGVG